ncbi:hypothetical protein CDAR_189851 [Caerostris darwini]|uniref:Uncharacterized protein n=1 Tax=Caerostris darwini TaxID=1538125 RepID=A0AAV4V248_9ARAC|nr:hypothetical protein CDAR_189851 [Caerostris darwini]
MLKDTPHKIKSQIPFDNVSTPETSELISFQAQTDCFVQPFSLFLHPHLQVISIHIRQTISPPQKIVPYACFERNATFQPTLEKSHPLNKKKMAPKRKSQQHTQPEESEWLGAKLSSVIDDKDRLL